MNSFTNTALNFIDRAIGGGKPSPAGTLAKEEQAVRTCFESVHGAGSADALYASELSKKLSSLADRVADWQARGLRVPPGPAAELSKLKTSGLAVENKIDILHRAMARPATPAAPMAPAPSPIPPSFVPAQAVPAPGITWNKPMLSALFDAVAGAGESAPVTNRPVVVDLKARAAAFGAVAPGNPLHGADVGQAFARQQQADEAAQAPERDAQDCVRLKTKLLGLGIKVTGLDYTGIPRPDSDDMELNPKTRELAQHNADVFMATIQGDPFAGSSNEPAAAAARRLIRATNGEFRIGATLGLKNL